MGTFHVNGGLWLGDVPIATFNSGRVTNYATYCRGSKKQHFVGQLGFLHIYNIYIYILEPELLNWNDNRYKIITKNSWIYNINQPSMTDKLNFIGTQANKKGDTWGYAESRPLLQTAISVLSIYPFRTTILEIQWDIIGIYNQQSMIQYVLAGYISQLYPTVSPSLLVIYIYISPNKWISVSTLITVRKIDVRCHWS